VTINTDANAADGTEQLLHQTPVRILVNDMPEIRLPEHPRGNEFEEFVSAYMQCWGRFIDRNLHERAPGDICEVDLVLTDHREDSQETALIEVKSGDWGISDIFTLRGKMHFLGVEDAALVTLGIQDRWDLKEHVAKKVGVKLVGVAEHAQAEEALRAAFGEVECLPTDVELWRYSYWVERVLLEELRQLRHTGDTRCGPAVVWEYQQSLQTNVFQRDMLQRTSSIYDLYRKNRHLSARWAAEMCGAQWDDEHESVPGNVFRDVYHNEQPHELNIVTFVETKSRLQILKNLVDYELYKRSHSKDEVNSIVLTVAGNEIRFVDMLPRSFRAALAELTARPFFHRYATLWQWFLWVFGGFLLLDYEEQEYENLSRVSGVPVEYVPSALEAFDLLFPVSGSWLRDMGEDWRIRLLVLAPMPFAGIGANYRRCLYAQDETYDGLALTGKHARSVLGRWNNCTVAYLSRKDP